MRRRTVDRLDLQGIATIGNDLAHNGLTVRAKTDHAERAHIQRKLMQNLPGMDIGDERGEQIRARAPYRYDRSEFCVARHAEEAEGRSSSVIVQGAPFVFE